MKIQTKTALLFTILTAGLMLLLSVLVYFSATRFTFQDFKKRLKLRALIAAKVKLEQDESNADIYHELQRRHLDVLPNQKEYFLRVDSVSGKIIHTAGLPVPEIFYQQARTTGEAIYERGHVCYAAVHYPDNEGEFIVVASAENQYGEEALRNLRTVFLACLLGGMGLVFTVGLFFSRKTFEPVNRLVTQIKSINAQNLHQRLPKADGKDEISELTNTFNLMLDRLETAFETQNNFVSNASHELSTPLTTVIGEAELALSRKRTLPEYEEALKIILQEAERLRQLTSGLLSLAQTSFSTSSQYLERVQVEDLIDEVVSTAYRLEPACKIEFKKDESAMQKNNLYVSVNAQLITLALSNIVMNACKYSGNQPVNIDLSFAKKQAIIQVTDRGIGIPAKDLSKIFVPFFRASNTVGVKGYGIGLPLAATIFRQHEASFQVDSVEGKGTKVTIGIPLDEGV